MYWKYLMWKYPTKERELDTLMAGTISIILFSFTTSITLLEDSNQKS